MTQSQLPEYISPENYKILFEPNLDDFTFSGKEEIQVKITKPTKEIVLNATELKISNPSIKTKDKTFELDMKYDKKSEKLTLSLPEQITGSAILSLDFSGILNDQLKGFYRSKYLDSKTKKEKYLATTQFEAPYARNAFPCFDQPDKKATFEISMLIPTNLQAISNMPQASKTTKEDKSLIKFEKTPLMSTYLLYLAVGEFEFLESSLGKVKIRIVTTPGKAKQGEFALDMTKKFLKYFEDYSEIPYPLPKLDMIAIPDFNAGAMENWGAITFREILLLHNKETSTRVKKRIAEVIAHELWHQWSGNLVTMKWWDDLWLNEAFATYMAYKAVNHYFPKWNTFEDFVANETERAFSDDSLKTTHPIAVPVQSPNQIEEIFDAISYGKGGSILRMIESYLSPEVFQEGVSSYLKKHKYKNAVAQDLWNSLSEVSDAPIKEIMKSWINQKGFPIIKAKLKGSSLLLTQEKFAHPDKTIWKIPLVIQTNEKTVKTILDTKSKTISIPKNTKWFKLNQNQEGFYRVSYDKSNLEKLSKLISQKKLSPFDRWGIQNDLFSLCIHNYLPLSTYLDILQSYNDEQNYFVLADIFMNIYKIYYTFSQEEFFPQIWPQFKEYTKTPFQKNFEKLGWNPRKKELQQDSFLRSLSVNYLGFIENQEIVKTGKEKLQNFEKSPESLHPDLRGAIYSITAHNGDKKIYNKLLSLYKKAENAEEKVKILISLYKFKSPQLLESSLDFALSKDVRSQDLRTVFSSASANPNIKPLLFTWIQKNWSNLEDYKHSSFIFMGILEALITSYCEQQKIKEIKSFLNSKKIAYEKTKANSFERAQINQRFLNNNKQNLQNYFKKA
tara:strand:+ start:11031 stop:13562 length:2532 start_codon:yes stop_codon:yes gene_type:complete